MRKVIWVVVLLVAAWCAWWWVASTGLQRGLDGWLAARSAEGWQADTTGIVRGGFPMAVEATLENLALADPDAGLAVRTERLVLSAPTWWPGDVTVSLDDGPIGLASPYGQSQLQMQGSAMSLQLHARQGLALEALGWTSGPWTVADDQGVRTAADDLTLTMTQVAEATYDFVAQANGFSPGPATRRGLELPDTFPSAFDSLVLRATATFDRPFDRRTLSDQRPQPRKIDIKLAEARWGDLRLNLAADLTVDAAGMPEGTVSLQAENWQAMLDIAETAGALPAGLRDQADRILAAMARASGNEATLDVDLTVRGGAVLLGFIPIARAPILKIR